MCPMDTPFADGRAEKRKDADLSPLAVEFEFEPNGPKRFSDVATGG